MFVRLMYLSLALALAPLPAAAQSSSRGERVVALVINVGGEDERADAIQAELQAIGVETLRSEDPHNAELRSILTRFAREAANSRATFVYLDAPVVTFQGRAFVLPAGTVLNRGTDLFTRAIPLQAFSRSAAQAAQGGATVATLASTDTPLPQSVSPATEAPAHDPTSSPVLTAPPAAFPGILEALTGAVEKGEAVELSTVLRRMSVQNGASISGFPSRPIFLKEPTAAAEEAGSKGASPAPNVPLPVTETPASSEQGTTVDAAATPNAPVETLQQLNTLEQSLPRAAKRTIQTQLRTLGFYNGLVDGIFGPQTRIAIKAFQDSRKEEQTGVLTRQQLTDLGA